MLFSETGRLTTGLSFDHKPVNLRILLDTVAQKEGFLLLVWFPHVITIPSTT